MAAAARAPIGPARPVLAVDVTPGIEERPFLQWVYDGAIVIGKTVVTPEAFGASHGALLEQGSVGTTGRRAAICSPWGRRRGDSFRSTDVRRDDIATASLTKPGGRQPRSSRQDRADLAGMSAMIGALLFSHQHTGPPMTESKPPTPVVPVPPSPDTSNWPAADSPALMSLLLRQAEGGAPVDIADAPASDELEQHAGFVPIRLLCSDCSGQHRSDRRSCRSSTRAARRATRRDRNVRHVITPAGGPRRAGYQVTTSRGSGCFSFRSAEILKRRV
jgi:hypothetical protein